MATSEHTPGPWTVDALVREYQIQVEDLGVYEVEEAHAQIKDLLEQERHDEAFSVAEANELLIAAAPDLLAACLAVQELCQLLPNTLADIKLLIDAAIAKARPVAARQEGSPK